jgi:hypothetical protein
VKDRVWKKLKGWKERCLSRAGKEVLIKSVAQAIPNYVMSCFKIPEGCCKEIEAMIARFWCGAKEGTRKLHWLSWDRMSAPKMKGGMGFRNFSDFNKALLGKQSWRLIKDEQSLMGRIFKSRYFPRGQFLEASVGYQPSYAWRSILSARDIVQKGAAWIIGNGRKVRIWKDNWVPPHLHATVFSPVRGIQEEATVNELIIDDIRMWDRRLLNQIFLPMEAQAIANIPLPSSDREDILFWPGEKSGEYSVRSAHHFLSNEKVVNQPGPSLLPWDKLWKLIWKLPLPTRV